MTKSYEVKRSNDFGQRTTLLITDTGRKLSLERKIVRSVSDSQARYGYASYEKSKTVNLIDYMTEEVIVEMTDNWKFTGSKDRTKFEKDGYKFTKGNFKFILRIEDRKALLEKLPLKGSVMN